MDVHRLKAAEMFGVPVNEVTPEQRWAAKAASFGGLYGGVTAPPTPPELDERIRILSCDDDPVRFIAKHGLQYGSRGVGRSQTKRITYILCPFHQEKHASFAMWAASETRTGRVSCFCFGCQWKGDLVSLAAGLDGLTREEILSGPWSPWASE